MSRLPRYAECVAYQDTKGMVLDEQSANMTKEIMLVVTSKMPHSAHIKWKIQT